MCGWRLKWVAVSVGVSWWSSCVCSEVVLVEKGKSVVDLRGRKERCCTDCPSDVRAFLTSLDFTLTPRLSSRGHTLLLILDEALHLAEPSPMPSIALEPLKRSKRSSLLVRGRYASFWGKVDHDLIAFDTQSCSRRGSAEGREVHILEFS